MVLAAAGIGALSLHLQRSGEVERPTAARSEVVERVPGLERRQLLAVMNRLKDASSLPGAGSPPVVESITFPEGTPIIYQFDPHTTVVWIVMEETQP